MLRTILVFSCGSATLGPHIFQYQDVVCSSAQRALTLLALQPCVLCVS